MILSILIATLIQRQDLFNKLNAYLTKQIVDNHLEGEVEILYFEDEGENPVGLKRNTLIENAKGDFVCFVDDDDWVPDKYVISIVENIKKHPDIDCIGFTGQLVSKSLGNKPFVHSIAYNTYSEDEKAYYRPPNHLNPIRRSIASLFQFPIINKGEDTDWTMQLAKSGLLTREAFIKDIMYYYNFEYLNSETQKKRKIVI